MDGRLDSIAITPPVAIDGRVGEPLGGLGMDWEASGSFESGGVPFLAPKGSRRLPKNLRLPRIPRFLTG